MVKICIYLFVILSFIGCVQKELVRDDISLKYRNYLTPDSIPLNLSNVFHEIKCDSFDVNLEKKIIYPLTKGEVFNYFYQKNDAFNYEYDKYMNGDQVQGVYRTPNMNKYNIFSCGKLKIHDDVEGYVLLFKTTFPIGEIYFNELMLFIVKEKKLCSIVELSRYNSKNKKNDNIISTYRTNRECYIHINYYGLFRNNTSNIFNINDVHSTHCWNILKTKLRINNKVKKLRYSMFYIDKIGFVRYTKENNLPPILTDKSTWKELSPVVIDM